MKNLNRDLLVLFRNEFMSEQAIEHEVECLNEILLHAEAVESFCIAHELVDRFRITRNPQKLSKAFHTKELKSFYFLINKN